MRASRIGILVSAGVLALVGLAACNTTQASAADSASVPAGMSQEATALATVGFEVADLTTEVTPADGSSPDTAANSDSSRRQKALRRIALRRNVLHGEFTVRTAQGDKLVSVQKGTVQSVDSNTIVVKSKDGFTQTWQRNDQTRVIKDRAKSDPSVIVTGTAVGMAGVKDGDHYVVRLVLIPKNPGPNF